MLVKTSELSGAALNWAVCKANGEHQHPYDEYTPTWMANRRYSEDWAKGGPIIERERIRLDQMPYPKELWIAGHDSSHDMVSGPTPLVAAMRCFVAFKLGEEVEIPKEVCDENL